MKTLFVIVRVWLAVVMGLCPLLIAGQSTFRATGFKDSLQTGLCGWWTFDEGAGTVARDWSGNRNHGTLSGAALPTWVTGKIGGALSFGGVSSYVAVADATSLKPTVSVSVSAWIYMNALGVFQVIVGKCWTTGLASGYMTAVDASNKFRMYVMDSSGTVRIAISTANIPATTWTHVCGIYNDGYFTGYINGLPDAGMAGASGGTGINETTFPKNLTIGKYSPENSNYLNGLIDDARIYNRALSTAEALALYNWRPRL